MRDVKNVVIIGLGGIGSALVEPLCRFIDSVFPQKTRIILVDGDEYEEKNLERQVFSMAKIGMNKAEFHHEKADSQFLQLGDVNSYPEFITPENIHDVIPDDSYVFSCVDNHKTRKNIQEFCSTLNDVVLISGGNELTDGNVQVFSKSNGRVETPRIDDERYHPEIHDPQDKSPEEYSCEELMAMGSEPQLLFTNLSVAVAMLNTFYARITNKLKYEELYLDIVSGKSLSKERKL